MLQWHTSINPLTLTPNWEPVSPVRQTKNWLSDRKSGTRSLLGLQRKNCLHQRPRVGLTWPNKANNTEHTAINNNNEIHTHNMNVRKLQWSTEETNHLHALWSSEEILNKLKGAVHTSLSVLQSLKKKKICSVCQKNISRKMILSIQKKYIPIYF